MASSGVLGNFGVSPMQHIVEVRVMNSENSTSYFLYLRRDRLLRFYDFILLNRCTAMPKPTPGPGISAPASTGLSAIFTMIPQKFPLADVLNWLRNEQHTYLGKYPNPTITFQEIELALAAFGRNLPLLRGDGSEIS
jgi:hypothetical protein